MLFGIGFRKWSSQAIRSALNIFLEQQRQGSVSKVSYRRYYVHNITWQGHSSVLAFDESIDKNRSKKKN